MGRDFKRAFRLDRSSAADRRASIGDELGHHVDLVAEELVAEGWEPDDAHREALRRFGDMQETKVYCADMQKRRGVMERRGTSIEESWQDLRYAVRTLIKAPGYAGLVIVTLAFGIAANSTIFSVMNPYFFRPLPYETPDQLVHVTQVDPVTSWDMDRLSLPTYTDWRDRSRAFQALGAYTYGSVNLTGQEGPESTNVGRITDNMFEILGVPAALGRTFGSGEGGPGSKPVVVLSHGLWQRRYTSDPGILGRAIMLDGEAHTVIGVMPPEFNFPFGGIRMWTPVRESAASAGRRRAPYLLVGRMNDGWDADRVDADLTAIQRELSAEYPASDGKWDGVTVLPVRQALNFAWDILTLSFTILLGAVVFVLMIACVNVASLTLARGSGRAREIAVRAAMGARRGRLVRQLLVESLILAIVGGAIGISLAYIVTGFVGPIIPEDLFRVGDVTVDRTVLAFSVLVTLSTPLLFGLLPALSATRRDLTVNLKEGSKGSGGRRASRGRSILVIAQVAMAVLLLSGAGLMIRSFASTQRIDVGFDADRILAITVSPPRNDYPGDEVRQYIERAIGEVEATPGVTSASATQYIPLNNESSVWQFVPSANAGLPAEEWPTAIANRPYPGYFAAMGIPLFAGRDFDGSDNAESASVVIVNQALADRYWPNANAVGRTVLVGSPTAPVSATVVGVVGGVLHEALNGDIRSPQMYRPALASAYRRHFLIVRAPGDPAALVSTLRQKLMALDPDLPASFRPMAEVVAQGRLQWSIGSAFLLVFGLGALLLATLGIYGLISFSVSQRERELGVRIALGATRGEIRRVVVGDGLKLTGIGIAIGMAASLALGPLIGGALYGVRPFDPITLITVLGLFTGVATLASWIPAARASGTDPIHVLRAE